MKKEGSHPFGQRLAAARKKQNLSQTELGKLMKVSRGMVAYYESSAKNPTIEVIENAAYALNINVAELLLDISSEGSRRPGPQSRLEQLLEQLSHLPKGKQKMVIEMLEGFLEKTAS
jgi:transcriptional regulator with XRE-family HTH domain